MLEPAARASATALLRERLTDASPLLHDPEFGLLVGAARHVLRPDNDWGVEGQPVLANWGLVPEATQRSKAARNRHLAARLGTWLPLAAAPRDHPRPGTPRRPRHGRAAAHRAGRTLRSAGGSTRSSRSTAR